MDDSSVFNLLDFYKVRTKKPHMHSFSQLLFPSLLNSCTYKDVTYAEPLLLNFSSPLKSIFLPTCKFEGLIFSAPCKAFLKTGQVY